MDLYAGCNMVPTRQRIGDNRFEKVAEHVWVWLFKEEKEAGAKKAVMKGKKVVARRDSQLNKQL